MDTFTRQYIETALWSSTDDDGEPLDKRFSPYDLPAETLARMDADCAKFQADNFELIADDLSRAGHDFWLTRNGHGAGFWDGDWPEHGNTLTAASAEFGECDLYIGEDGNLYLFPPA
jgi:hypothetical protein